MKRILNDNIIPLFTKILDNDKNECVLTGVYGIRNLHNDETITTTEIVTILASNKALSDEITQKVAEILKRDNDTRIDIIHNQ